MRVRRAFFVQNPQQKTAKCLSSALFPEDSVQQKQQNIAKEILIRFDEQNFHHPSSDPSAIQGWGHSLQDNLQAQRNTKKQIRPHKNRRFSFKLEVAVKSLQNTDPKQSINYLKRMLNNLRSSRDSTPPLAKPARVQPLPVLTQPLCSRNALSSRGNIEECEGEIQNSVSQKDVIDQLVNGLWKLPSLRRGRGLMPRSRAKKAQKFTLDKLLA